MTTFKKGWEDRYKQRQKEMYDSRNDSGRFKSIFKDLPEGVEKWKCETGEHNIDILLYPAGKNDPEVRAGKLQEGDPQVALDVWIHTRVGAAEDNYICLSRTYKEKCPICERRNALRKTDDYDEEEVKALNPTRRHVYNVWVHDSAKEEDKGVQVFDVSQYLFGLELTEQSKLPMEGGFEPYAHPDQGKIVNFTKSGKQISTKFKSFHFLKRPKPLPANIRDGVLVLDEYLYIPTYEEVKNAFMAGGVSNASLDEQFGGDDVPDFVPPEEEKQEDPREAKRREREARLKAQQEATTHLPENECPSGFVFGADIDKKKEVCDVCEKWDACSEKADELLNQPAEKKEPPKPAATKPLIRRPGR